MTATPTTQAVELLTALSELDLPEPVLDSNAHIEKGFAPESVEVFHVGKQDLIPVGPVNTSAIKDDDALMVTYRDVDGVECLIDIFGVELRQCNAEGVMMSYLDILTN